MPRSGKSIQAQTGLGHFPWPVSLTGVYGHHSKLLHFPSSLHTDSKYHAQSSEPLFLLCPKLLHCHVLLFCIKFHHISVAQDLVGAASEEAEALSPYCLVLYISILKPNTCSLLNFHDVLLPQMRKVTQSCETAQGYDGVLQDLSFFVSNPIFKLRVHKQKLLSTQHLPPQHQEEVLRLTPRVVWPFLLQVGQCKRNALWSGCFESCDINYK